MKNPTLYKGIYAISDGSRLPILTNKVQLAIEGGASIIQYRDKSSDQNKRHAEALAIKKLCDTYQIPLLINDDVQLADAISADGVHLGNTDLPLAEARTVLGVDAIIGVSCYNQLGLAVTAEQEGANYVAFGSMFASPTKPNAPRANIDLLVKARQQLSIPICCIGGINKKNASGLIKAGADMIALISALFAESDPKRSAESFSKLYTSMTKATKTTKTTKTTKAT